MKDKQPTLQKNVTRNSSVEVLRIVAMLFVVMSHICVHGGYDIAASPLSLNKFFVQWGVLGNLGVDIFVLISGYFLCQREFRTSALSKLLVQVWFYSIVLFLVCRFGFGYSYGPFDLLAVVFPTIFNEYWFFTAYVVLMILSPYLNILIRAAEKKQLEAFLVCMLLLWVVIPTFTAQNMYGTHMPQFFLFYVLGAYFSRYPDNLLKKKTVRIAVVVGSFFLLFLSTVVLDYLGTIIPIFANRGTAFYGRNSLLIVGAALGLFSCAIYARPFYNSTINSISGCMLGVYLIHDNPAVRDILWGRLLNNAQFFSSPSLVFRMLGSWLLVFVVCTAVEYVRNKTIAAPMAAALDRGICKILQILKLDK